jgi:formylglycine-generating enzyme required for sulfatase activity
MDDNQQTTSSGQQWILIAIICVVGIAAVFIAYDAGTKKRVVTPSANSESIANASPEDMVLIPAGEFVMGSDDVDASGKSQEFGFNEPLYLNEHPQRTVSLDAFYIDKYEVTNGEFKQYLRSLGRY